MLLWTWSWSVWWLTTALNFPSTKTHLQRFFILYFIFITGSLCKKSLAFRTLAEVNRGGDMCCSGSRLGWLRVSKLPARFRCTATARVLEDHWKTQKAPCMSYWPYTHPKKSPKHGRKYWIHGASGKAFNFSPLHEEKQSILPAWVRFCPLVLLKVEIFGWNLVPVFERDFARANDVNLKIFEQISESAICVCFFGHIFLLLKHHDVGDVCIAFTTIFLWNLCFAETKTWFWVCTCAQKLAEILFCAQVHPCWSTSCWAKNKCTS